MNDKERLVEMMNYIDFLDDSSDMADMHRFYDTINKLYQDGDLNWIVRYAKEQADQVEKQQKGIEQLNNFIQFQRDVLDETKMELKGAKEDYSRLLKTAEEITEQHRQEIERLNAALQKRIKDFSNLQQRESEVRLHWIKENARLRQALEESK